MTQKTPASPRCAAIVGPYLSGKTTLLESLLVAAGAVNRKGAVKDGNTVGDGAPEARARQMSTEPNVVTATYLDEEWTFVDCPGSIELLQDGLNAMVAADIAVIVCEPDPAKALAVSPLLKMLDDHNIPHLVFVNKMDQQGASVKATLEALQNVSERPLVLREIPIRDGEAVSGHVDLVSERAFQWNDGDRSTLIQIPATTQDREAEARTEMLETLADFDDSLLEELLEEVTPSTEEIYDNLTRDLQQDLIVPVFFGSAENDHGITRLLKALRHETPEVTAVAERLGVAGGDVAVQVFKTFHAGHTGKLSVARVLAGKLSDGDTLDGERVSGLYRMIGQKQEKLSATAAGAVVAMGRMDSVTTGDLLTAAGRSRPDGWPETLVPLYSMAVHADKRADEVKLSGALAKVAEEDPSISYEASQDTGELLLWGQGEMHLQIALDRLRNRFHLEVSSQRPHVAYKETIRKPVSQHARHKKQSGGHGEFGDVHLDIKPLPRGEGFSFTDSITGGVVPKQYIPAVEIGVKDYLGRGPLGFPVVDVAVNLSDGQYHTVDSSDMAFRKAGAQAMREGMPKCGPVLLEPILNVRIAVPNEFTSRVQRLVSGRRGQILGFDAKPGWKNWDEVACLMPQSEIHDLIIELRSLTMGTGSYTWTFDHLQELTGRIADDIVAQRAAELEAN
ncbi:MAG: elongation factor G [Hyphomicrobiales bacterium]|nr:elongation factor G [Hyphomicrobiales bacterium]MCP5373106.1 elongation factor G [Hyphomicrobiales bacterium]